VAVAVADCCLWLCYSALKGVTRHWFAGETGIACFCVAPAFPKGLLWFADATCGYLECYCG